MKKLILALTLAAIYCHASDWLCSTGGSTRSDTSISVCGIGVADTEALAKNLALEDSMKEYRSICSLDAVCKEKKVVLDFKRTETLKQKDGSFESRRLVIFNFSNDNGSEIFDQTTPFIERHISRETVLKRFGVPTSISDNNNFKVSFYYHNKPFCEPQGCTVNIELGRVQNFSGFKPEATDMVREPASVWKSLKRQLYLSDD